MQFSETVLAAMIGAIATVSTALFQLVTALRARNKLEIRPKKGRTLRPVVAIIALVAASGVGGYLYAGMRQQSANEDLRSMREELNAKLQLLATTTERIAQAREPMAQPHVAALSIPQVSEAVVFASACQSGATGTPCSEANAQRLMLCGAVPTNMHVRKLDLFAKGANSPAAWEQSGASFEQDLGGAKFTGSPIEHPQDESRKAVCVDFMHWSSEPHLARVVIQYEAMTENLSLPQSSAPQSSPQPSPIQTSLNESTAAASTVSVPAAQGLSLISPIVQ